jgi:hypothetical protein
LLPLAHKATLTPAVYEAIVTAWHDHFGAEHAGWAFMQMFVAELADFRKRVVETPAAGVEDQPTAGVVETSVGDGVGTPVADGVETQSADERCTAETHRVKQRRRRADASHQAEPPATPTRPPAASVPRKRSRARSRSPPAQEPQTPPPRSKRRAGLRSSGQRVA